MKNVEVLSKGKEDTGAAKVYVKLENGKRVDREKLPLGSKSLFWKRGKI